MKFLTLILVVALVLIIGRSMLFSFRAQTPAEYSEKGPAFDVMTHLNGEIKSEGLIFGPKGRMDNSFVADMSGTWTNQTGRLQENFTYSNGRKQTREWTITLGDDNTLTVTAPDVIGEGKGVISGNALQVKYRLKLPEEAGGQEVDVIDWLFATESGVVMNRTQLYKFGILVAELVATMRPVGVDQVAAE